MEHPQKESADLLSFRYSPVEISVLLYFVAGLVLLIVGAEALVRGASRLAGAMGVSPLVIGLTVVAFGTSSPELAVSVKSAFAGEAEIAVGNVVGSNIFNVLFILGLSALVIPLVVDQQLIRLDVPLMIAASFVFYGLALDGEISRVDGLLLFSGIVAYTVFLIRQSRKESAKIKAEYAQEFGEAPPPVPTTWLVNLGLTAAGVAMLVIGADWLVDGATAIAARLGVSQLVIGLTIIAAGTSLPEAATSVVAALRGERDIAVGNVVGSNLFNLLCVLGAAGAVAPGGLPVSSAALRLDIPVMIAVAVACLPIFFTGRVIARWEGALFLAYYGAYTAYLVLGAAEHAARAPLGIVLAFVIPLTALTLLVLAVRAIRQERDVRRRESSTKS